MIGSGLKLESALSEIISEFVGEVLIPRDRQLVAQGMAVSEPK